ncbi:MAG: helix-turn-helix transcriptional regulator [Nitrososphaerota archaeon]|nr:helix-turn-helix transcriptional regulator [Nitrososphaerota archaeon]
MSGGGRPEDEEKKSQENVLVGTTLAVYRYLYRAGKPEGIRDVQKGLNLSSPSVAQYHVRKLLQAGLLREEEGGYVVDKNVFENVIRIRRSIIPIQVAYSMFFATMLVALFVLFRPMLETPLFIFSFIAIAVAMILFAYQAFRSRNYPLR